MKKGARILIIVLVALVVALAGIAGAVGYRIVKAKNYQKQFSLGAKYLAELDYENAEICFQKAIEIDDKRVASYVQLSIVYVEQQRYGEAKEMLEKAASCAKGEKAEERLEKQLEIVEQKEKKVEEEAVFNSYLRDTLITQKKLADLSRESWGSLSARAWYDPQGVLSALIEDLDGDGELEMLVLSMEKPQAEAGGTENGINLRGEVYEIEDGEVRLSASEVLRGYHEREPYSTVSSIYTSEVRLYATMAETDGERCLIFEKTEMAAYATGMQQDFWIMSYENEELQMEAAFNQPGGSVDFMYTGYYFDDGELEEKELLYGDFYPKPEGKYGSLEEAVAGFFGEMGLEASCAGGNESVLSSENRLIRILDYRTEVAERPSDYRRLKFRLTATDYTKLRERLEQETGAAGQEPAPEPAQEPEPESIDQGWREQYISHIQNLEGAMEYTRYGLAYINDDDIPELVIDYGTTAGGAEVCTYYQGEVVSLRLEEYGLSYIERGNLFRESGGRMDIYSDNIYRIEDGQFVKVASGEYGAEDNTQIQLDEEGLPIYQYAWNGQSVDEEGYESGLRAAIDVDAAVTASAREEKEEIIERIRSMEV